MQVKLGEREKKIIKLSIRLFRKKLGKRGTPESIHKDLMSISYSPIKRLVTVINKTAKYTDHKYQRDVIRGHGEIGIWLIVNHPVFKNMISPMCKGFTDIDVPIEPFIYKTKLTKFELWVINKILIFTKNKLLEPGGLYHYIKQDIEVTQNEVGQYLLSTITKELDQIEDKEIKESVTMLSDIFIWCMIRDTAYRDQFFWSLWQIGNKEVKRRIRLHPTKLVRPPRLWYSNLWLKGGRESKKQRASGELMLGEFSTLESPCVPHIQNKEVKRGFKR